MRGVRSCRLRWKWASPAPRRDAVASVPFRLLLGQAVSVGGSLEGILWLCRLYPNVRNFVCVQSPIASRSAVKWRICFRGRLLNNLSPIKSGSEVRSYRSMTSGFRPSGLRYNRATKAKNDSTSTHLWHTVVRGTQNMHISTVTKICQCIENRMQKFRRAQKRRVPAHSRLELHAAERHPHSADISVVSLFRRGKRI